jgi:hypothetical protein
MARQLVRQSKHAARPRRRPNLPLTDTDAHLMHRYQINVRIISVTAHQPVRSASRIAATSASM